MEVSKFLFISDDRKLIKECRDILRSQSIELDVAFKPRTGLEKFKQGSYEGVIVDFKLPQQGCRKVFPKLIASKKWQPILLILPGDKVDRVHSYLDAGATHYFVRENLTAMAEVIPALLNMALREKSLLDEYNKIQIQLVDSKQRYRRSTEFADEAVWENNLKTGEHFISTRFTDILGYKLEDIKAKNIIFDNLVHPDDRDQETKITDPIWKKGEYALHLRLKHKKGHYVWIGSKEHLYHDAEGRPEYSTRVLKDVTQRIKAEQQTREAKSKYHQFFDEALDGIILFEPITGIIRDVNPIGASQFGYEVEELIGQNVELISRLDDVELVDRRREILKGDNLRKKAVPLYRKDGSIIHADINSSAVTIAGEDLILSNLRNINDMMAIERELQLADRVLESASDYIVVIGRDYKYKKASKLMIDALGAEKETLTKFGPVDFFGKKGFEEIHRPRLDQCFLGQSIEVEEWIKFKSGQKIYGLKRLIPVANKNGEIDSVAIFTRDLTQRKRAEEKVESLNEELATQVDALQSVIQLNEKIWSESPIGFAIFDSTGQCQDVNEALVKLIGTTVENYLTQNFKTMKTWQKYGMLEAAKKAMQERTVCHHEYTLKTKFGKNISVEMHFVPFEVKNDTQLLIITNDITDRISADRKLRELNKTLESKVATRTQELVSSQEKLTGFIEAMADRYWEVDKDYKITFMSDPKDGFFLPSENSMGKTFWQIRKERGHLENAEQIEVKMKSKLPFRDIRSAYWDENQNLVWLNRSGQPIYNEKGNFEGYYGVTSNITEVVKAEDLAKSVEVKFVEAMDSLKVGFCLWDADNQFLSCNENFKIRRPFLSPVLKPGCGYDDYLKVIYDVRTKETNHEIYQSFNVWRKARYKEITNVRFEHRFQIGGNWFQLVKMRNADGSILSLISDITQIKEAELQISHTQKMDSLGNLAGGIAHTLNNLLLPIVSLSSLQLKKSPVGSESHKVIATIVEAAGRAQEEVARILKFSRRSDRAKEIIDTHELIKSSIELFRAGLPKSLAVREHIQSNICPVSANRIDLETVLLNLVNNAAAAFSGAAGWIEVSLSEIELKETKHGLDAGRYVKLGVSDNGPGIDSEVLSRVFDPYFTTKEVGEGTGLGLSIAHQIIKEHEGAILVSSVLGEGSEFQVFLPAVEQQDRI